MLWARRTFPTLLPRNLCCSATIPKHYFAPLLERLMMTGSSATPVLAWETRVLSAEKGDKSIAAALQPAVDLLKAGEVVAVPTETVYGLAANALNGEAVKKVYLAKGRPADNPLICHIASMDMLPMLVDMSEPLSDAMRKLMDSFWPGPLTILMRKNPAVPDEVTCGLPTVGVRMPSHPVARSLIELCGFPLAAPSANASGRPSPTRAEHVLHDLSGRIPMVVDGGQADCGVESTVVDMSRAPPAILRPGGVTLEQLRTLLPDIQVHGKDFVEKSLEESPSTPGMKYMHYTPRAPVILVEAAGSDDESLRRQFLTIEEQLVRILDDTSVDERPQMVGLLSVDGDLAKDTLQRIRTRCPNVTVVHRSLGTLEDMKTVAFELFAGLRDLDSSAVSYIVVEGVCEEHEGLAVMNRLRKAAGTIVKPS